MNSKVALESAKVRRKSVIQQGLEVVRSESGTWIASLDFSGNTEDACDQYADAGNVEMKLDDAYASSAFANEALDSHFSSC